MKKITKKFIFWGLLLSGIIIVLNLIITKINFNLYKESINNYVNGLIKTLKKTYPDINEKQIVELLNQDKKVNFDGSLKKYGINSNEAILYNLEQDYRVHQINSLIFLVCICLSFWVIFIKYFYLQEKKIKKITNYMKKINQGIYLLEIESNSEGELSILHNEVYKTTIMLREESEILKKEKLALKDSISNISHQLKTPLTSILIMIDNILDNPKMDNETKTDFILNVHHQVEHINSLIISLLKLSRIEVGVIQFKKEKINVLEIINDVLKNIKVLKDDKRVDIVCEIDDNIFYNGDYQWEVEALSNIIKNAIEYSKRGNKIEIKAIENVLYTKIIIKDYGVGMNEKELKNVFKRFYKGENSNNDSIGIGLNLAKNIIEKDGGFIKADSKKNKGTTFEIRYFK